jgi:formyl-CoA transferase
MSEAHDGLGPLAGYRVIDITQMIAGPVGCTLLSDMGAEVIKVEPIDGESTRHTASIVPLEGLAFVLMNRGKKSVPVNLRLPEGREVVHRLVRAADIVVVGYRPDVCLDFGLDYETLRAVNPEVIYLQNTAFGTAGPMALQGGYDLVVQGISGLIALNANVDEAGQPKQIVPAYADYLTAAYIALAVTTAVMVKERTGRGQRIDTSLLHSALYGALGRHRYVEAVDAGPREEFLAELRRLRAENRPWKEQLALRADARVVPANIYYRAYATADSYLMVACLNNPTRVKFLQLTGLEDFRMVNGRLDVAIEPSKDTPERREKLDRLVRAAEAVVRSKTTSEWLRLFVAAKVPAGPLRFPEEVLEDEQVLANGYFQELEHPVYGAYQTVTPPVRMSLTPWSVRGTAPVFGQDTREVLAGLGYSEAEVASLVEKGALAVRD